MKKLIFALCLSLALLGCTKNDNRQFDVTYRVNSDGMKTTIAMLEYGADKTLANSTLTHDVEKGKKYTFTATPYTNYLVVQVQWKSLYLNKTFYVAKVYHFADGERSIVIDDNTVTQSRNPMLN